MVESGRYWRLVLNVYGNQIETKIPSTKSVTETVEELVVEVKVKQNEL